jgi:hypothetical protein
MILGCGKFSNQVGHVGGVGNMAGSSYSLGEQKEVGSEGSVTVGHPARTPRASDLPELPHSPQPAHSPAAHAEERGAPPAPRSVSRKRAREDEPAAAAPIAAGPNAVAAAGEAAKQPPGLTLDDASWLHFTFAQGTCARAPLSLGAPLADCSLPPPDANATDEAAAAAAFHAAGDLTIKREGSCGGHDALLESALLPILSARHPGVPKPLSPQQTESLWRLCRPLFCSREKAGALAFGACA